VLRSRGAIELTHSLRVAEHNLKDAHIRHVVIVDVRTRRLRSFS
jgi:hypothetical protein